MKRAVEAEEDSIKGFPIDALPVDVIIQIAYKQVSLFKTLFQITRTMNETQARRGFWLALFKLGYPETALTLACFLEESTNLMSLSQEARTDILLLTSAFDSFAIAKAFRTERNEYNERTLATIEANILNGDLEYFDVLYGVNMDPDGTLNPINNGFYAFPTRIFFELFPFISRSLLISLYLLLQRSQQVNALDQTLEFIESLKPDSTQAYGLPLSTLFLDLVDLWKEEFAKQRVKRLTTGLVNELDALADKFNEQIDLCIALDQHTGKPSTAASVYFPPLYEKFQDYFGLTAEEADVHWKKIYIKLVRYSTPLYYQS